MADLFDIKLLRAIQRDDGRTADQLAEEVNLSPSALARRLRRLRATGLVERTVALINPALLRHRLRALVRVQLQEHASERGLADLRRALEQADAVQWCAEVSGDDDLVILVDCRDMEAFNRFADRLLAADPAVRRYETSFIKREAKLAPFVALESLDIPLLEQFEKRTGQD